MRYSGWQSKSKKICPVSRGYGGDLECTSASAHPLQGKVQQDWLGDSRSELNHFYKTYALSM